MLDTLTDIIVRIGGAVIALLSFVFRILLTVVRYIMSIGRKDMDVDDILAEAEAAGDYIAYPYEAFPVRTEIERLEAEAAILFENDRIILTVDYDFLDVPSWVEGDGETRNISIAMMGGGTVILKLPLPMGEIERIKQTKYMVFVSGTGNAKLMHNISFIYKG